MCVRRIIAVVPGWWRSYVVLFGERGPSVKVNKVGWECELRSS